jgi:hypothetical protein
MRYAQLSMRFFLPLLSDNANIWEVQMGIFDSASGTNKPSNGAWIMGNTNLGTANFYLCNGTNSNYSYTDTGIPMTTTNWHDWAVRLTPSNSIALYAGTAVATNSTMYPTTFYLSSWGMRMVRLSQTALADRYIYIDNGRIRFRAGPNR